MAALVGEAGETGVGEVRQGAEARPDGADALVGVGLVIAYLRAFWGYETG